LELNEKICKYLQSNGEHSTIVGRTITLDHLGSEDDHEVIQEFASWMTSFLQRVEDFSKKN